MEPDPTETKYTDSTAIPETTLSENMSESELVTLDTEHEMAETIILSSISDDNEEQPLLVTEKRSKPKSRRSPNRDDSDSDDDDDQSGSKLGKNTSLDGESETSFNMETDAEYQNLGFKVGFSEDRNKRYRRTMEDAHTINTAFIEGGGGRYFLLAFFAVFDGHAGRAAADFCGQRMQQVTVI